jgi:hypothetical protein
MKSNIGSLLGVLRGPRSEADKKGAKAVSSAVPVRKPSPGSAGSRHFQAVVIKPGKVSCEKAIELSGGRMLARQACVPLPECTMPNRCTCVFQKFDDRRERDRRLGLAPDQRLFLSPSQRIATERRGKDNQNSPRERRVTGKKT